MDQFSNKMYDLIFASLSGIATEDQQVQLAQILEDNRTLRKEYVDYLITFSLLSRRRGASLFIEEAEDSVLDERIWEALAREEVQAKQVVVEKPESDRIQKVEKSERPGSKREINKTSFVTGLLSVAALFIVISALHFIPSNKSIPVASITGVFNAQWSPASEEMSIGSRIWNDGYQYHLDRGVIEITFDNGVKTLVEAPCQYKLINENEMFFEGSLTAHVPPAGIGFTINTHSSKVVDLGTRFGLRTNNDGRETEVHVLKGKVELTAAGSKQKNPSKQFVHAGQGCRVDHSGSISKTSFRRNTFLWEKPSPYEQAVYSTQPVHYWRFDRDNYDRILNEMDVGDFQTAYRGQVEFNAKGPGLGDNRSNRALKLFGLKGKGAELGPVSVVNQNAELRTTGNYSISMWIRPDAYGLQNIFLYSNEHGPMRAMTDRIYLTNDNQFAFYVATYDVSGDYYKPTPAITATDPVKLNMWYHVVGSYTKDRVKLYVNGRLEDESPLRGHPEKYYEIAWIGSGSVDLSVKNEFAFPFKGAVDEISLYNRELSLDEIRMLYETAEHTEEHSIEMD